MKRGKNDIGTGRNQCGSTVSIKLNHHWVVANLSKSVLDLRR